MIDVAGETQGETIELRIDSIAAGGDGVGRHEGLVVFVPRTAPGDLVRARAVKHDRLMRGLLVEVLEPSLVRADPPCEHYVIDRCGGCQIQHLTYEGQLAAKAGIVHDSLTRIGRVAVDRPSVQASDKHWRYRRKLTLALRLRGDRWVAGLHRYDAPDDVFELRDCPITDEKVIQAWALVLAQQARFPMSRSLRAAVRLLPHGFAFTLEGGREWKHSTSFFADIPSLLELWWKPEDRSRRLLQSRASVQQAGASFTQVNAGVAEQLREWVLSLATARRPATAIDAYSGTGDIAVALALAGAKVTAIEIDRDASRVAAARLPDGSRCVTAPVEKALAQALPADVVVLNPPRAGVDTRVAELLTAQRPNAVVYVSCDPATLARDIRRMPGFRVASLRGFDMFPQTAHVETVCELVAAA